MSLDLILRIIGDATSGKKALKDTEKAAGDTDEALDKIGSNTALEKAEARAKSFWASVDTASEKVENLNRTFEKMRNWGAGIAAAGAMAVMAGDRFADMARDVEESESLVGESFGESREQIEQWSQALQDSLGITATDVRRNAATFNVMFDSMGIAEDKAVSMSKTLTELAYDMASFYNLSNQEAFDKLSAGITGEAEPLKRLGILINEQTIAQYAYANGIAKAGETLTEQQKVMARYGAILQQTTKAQGDLARTADSATNTQKRMEQAAERAMTAIGSGSASAQKGLDMMLARLLAMAGANEAAASGVGWIMTVGGYAASAGGGLLALVGQIGLAKTGLEAMGISGTISLGAIRTAALSTAVGINAVTLGVTGIAIAAAATVGYVAYAVGQHIGWLDKEQSFVERLTTGWWQLSDWILRTSNISGAAREQNEKDLQAEIDKLKTDNQKAVDDGKMTREQANKANREGEIALLEQFGNEQRRIGDDANYVKNKERAEQLRQQQQIGGGVMPPVVPSIAPVVAAGAASAPSGAATPGAAAKATTATANQAQKAAEKVAREEEKQKSDLARRKADIEIAQLEEEYDTRIARLNANKGNEALAKQLEAEKRLKAAEIRARLDDDKSGLEVAKIRYRGEMERAGIVRASDGKTPKEGKFSLPQAMASLRRGGSVFGFREGGNDAPGGGTGSSGAGSGSASPKSAPLSIQMKPENFKTRELPNRKLEVILSGRFIVDNPLSDAVGAF